ncbi:MAG TPA: O-antigen polymerase [Candidatus Angelobacter sp.]|nr:O-antigen polymerase [Candidatus Angelobacter sp.]
MLWLTILVLSLLAFFNYRIGGKALLYPPVVFCGIWAFDLFLVWVAGDYFYPMLPETLFIFICGAFVFSLGCWVAVLFKERIPPPKPVLREASNRIITILVVLLALGAPLYYRWLSGVVSAGGGTAAFLALARVRTMELMGKSPAFTFFATMVEISVIVAMIAFWEKERHPKRAVFAVVLALFMGGIMGQKVGPLTLVVGLLGIDWIKNRRIRWKVALVMVLVMVIAIVVIELYVHLNGSLQEQAGPILRQFALYSSGGMVGFDRMVREPNIVPQPNPIYVWYLRIIRRLGTQVEIPEVSDFVTVGPQFATNNVYTVYGEYLDWGYAGAILWVGGLGLLATLVYKRALQGRMISILLYGILLRNIVFSPFTEYFVSNAYLLVKVIAVAWLVYSLPVQWAQFKNLIGSAVQADLAKSR